nr:reverse transcriptase domain-containing protein [Tanacetum cinerariifolium]
MAESGKFKPLPPMVTSVKKKSSNKFCEFHNDKGYITDECVQLRKQIEELVRAGKLSHFIKEIRRDRDQQKTRQTDAPVKDKAHLYDTTMAESDATKEINSQMVSATTSLTDFSGETIWPIGQLRLLVTIRDAEHYTRAWMNFMIVRSPSPYNSIIRRPGIREIQAVPSTDHGMLKFPVKGEIVTIRSTILTPTECTTIAATPKDHAKKAKIRHDNFKVALHPDFLDQEITIIGTVSIIATELCTL